MPQGRNVIRDEMSWGEMSQGEMLQDKMSWGEMLQDEMSYNPQFRIQK